MKRPGRNRGAIYGAKSRGQSLGLRLVIRHGGHFFLCFGFAIRRRVRDRAGRGVGELVAVAHNEGIEGKFAGLQKRGRLFGLLLPEGVALETMTVTDLGDGRTRLHAASLTDSFEGRDAWLASGMEVGITDGYAKLDALLAK